MYGLGPTKWVKCMLLAHDLRQYMEPPHPPLHVQKFLRKHDPLNEGQEVIPYPEKKKDFQGYNLEIHDSPWPASQPRNVNILLQI